jgi:FMN phosphatase YigB (HAD superfamily)
LNTVQAIIFDLDDTLFPVSSLPPALVAPVIEAARRANAGPDAIPVDRLERAIAEAMHLPFPVIAGDHALPPSIIRAWDAACRGLKSPDVLQPFDDVRPVLSGLGQRRLLVTTGYTAFQLGKLAALGISSLFEDRKSVV